jgi:hypothetical protein
VSTLPHRPISCEKVACKLIHTARHTLSPLGAQTVNTDIGKTMAARYQTGRPGMCAFWLREDSASEVLAQLIEQLVVGLLHTEVGSRLDRDCKAVYDVLAQITAEPGSTATLFVEFYSVWKLQVGLVTGTMRIEAKSFAQRALRVFEHGLIPPKFWLLMFQHLLAPLLEVPWRGHVFDVDHTYTLMRHFETAMHAAQFANDLYGLSDGMQEPEQGAHEALKRSGDAIRYALTENLSEASINSLSS